MQGLKALRVKNVNAIPVITVGDTWRFESKKPKRRVTDAPLLIVAILVYAKDALTAEVFADRPTSPCIVGADQDGQLFMFLPRMAKVKDFDLTVVI